MEYIYPQRVSIRREVLEKVQHHRPYTIPLNVFVNTLLDEAISNRVANLTQTPLESPRRRVLKNSLEKFGNESELVTRKSKQEREKPLTKYRFTVPKQFEYCKEELKTFWKNKPVKTEAAAKILFTELKKIQEDSNKTIVIEEILEATSKGWKSITFKNYVRYKKPPETEVRKHPAQKVTTFNDMGFING